MMPADSSISSTVHIFIISLSLSMSYIYVHMYFFLLNTRSEYDEKGNLISSSCNSRGSSSSAQAILGGYESGVSGSVVSTKPIPVLKRPMRLEQKKVLSQDPSLSEYVEVSLDGLVVCCEGI